MLTIYDEKFNANEWFSIILLVVGFILVWRFKKRFSTKEVIFYMVYSYYMGMLFDHTIGIGPFDYYDVNDTSLYEFYDFLTYLMYAPYSYVFVYIYDYFKIKSSHAPVYILFWALGSTLLELIGDILGVYHYKNGYEIYYSFPIYLLILTPPICFYKLFHSNKINI